METDRAARAEYVRAKSDRYGIRYCSDHALSLAQAVRDKRRGVKSEHTARLVRVYSRVDNRMWECTLDELLSAVQCDDDDDDAPRALRQTAYGQVALAENMHVSTAVYTTIRAVWKLAAAP